MPASRVRVLFASKGSEQSPRSSGPLLTTKGYDHKTPIQSTRSSGPLTFSQLTLTHSKGQTQAHHTRRLPTPVQQPSKHVQGRCACGRC